MKFMGRVLLGIPVSFVILAIGTLSIRAAFVIIIVSIICTAGAGLIVWIPLWWILGSGVASLFPNRQDRLNRQDRVNKQDHKEGAPRSSMSVSLVTLAQFIRDALTVIDDNSAGGRSEAEVTSLCQRAGWSDTEIQDARRTGCIKQQATKKLSTGGVHLSAKAAVRDAFRGLIRWVDRWFIR